MAQIIHYNTNVRIEILKVDLHEKVSPCKILGEIDQNLNFQDGVGGNLGYCHVTKNAGTIARDLGAKFVVKGSNKLE